MSLLPMNQTLSEETIQACLSLSKDDIARLVLCLLIEEMLKDRLTAFRSQDLPAKPTEGLEELFIAGDDVMPVGNRPR